MTLAPVSLQRTRSQVMRAWQMAPWRLWYGLRSLVCSPWYRVYFALCGVPYGRGWRMYGRPTIHRCKGSHI